MIKVKELIEELQELDPDIYVFRLSNDNILDIKRYYKKELFAVNVFGEGIHSSIDNGNKDKDFIKESNKVYGIVI